MTVHIYALYHLDFTGDRNQVRGVAASLKSQFRRRGIKTLIEEIKEKNFKLPSNNKDCYIVTAGSHGLEIAKKIKKESPKERVIWSGHQPFKALDSGVLPNIVALPQGTCDTDLKENLKGRTKLILTDGVPHVVSADTVAADVEKVGTLVPRNGQKMVGIILGGDAPAPDGMRFFDEADARRCAGLIAAQLKTMQNSVVHVTNGPRTGSHDHKTGQRLDPCPHRIGQQDAITRVFVGALKEQLGEAIPIHVHDFQFAHLPSAYKPLLDAVRRTRGVLFVPSESTSMVTESQYVRQGGADVVVYSVSSENPSHTAHMNATYQHGCCQILQKGGQMKAYTQDVMRHAPLAADAIAKEVIRPWCLPLRLASVASLAALGLFSLSRRPLSGPHNNPTLT